MNLKLRTFAHHGAPIVLAAGMLFSLSGAGVIHGATDGPLRVSHANPRYFQDAAGHVVYLTGSHTWGNLQDQAPVGQRVQVFDYKSYLAFLRNHDMNFIRLWSYEGWEFCDGMKEPWYHVPLYYARTGPGTALDGGLKFDVRRFDQAYFDRLRSRVIAARDDGMYVSIMLFQGWSACSKRVWQGHPFNASNNINGVNGDLNNDGAGLEVHSLLSPTINVLQEAYIRKVVDTLNDPDNVLYEISNEGECDIKWKDFMAGYLKHYEASKPLQHPVGITYNVCMTQADMYDSPVDWISPGGSWGYADNPPTANGRKVMLTDTDHIRSGLDGTWVWKSFTRGLNPIYMDDLSRNSVEESARVAMGQTKRYADKIHLASMMPHGDLTSTSYALAEPGHEYLVYDPAGGSFSIDLSRVAASDIFSIEWFHPIANGTIDGGTVTAGAIRTLTPPFFGAAVAHLLKQSSGTSPAPTAMAIARERGVFVLPAAFGTVLLALFLYFVLFERPRR